MICVVVVYIYKNLTLIYEIVINLQIYDTRQYASPDIHFQLVFYTASNLPH